MPVMTPSPLIIPSGSRSRCTSAAPWLLLWSSFPRQVNSGSDPASRHRALFAVRGCFPVKPVGQRPLGDFGEALPPTAAPAATRAIDDGDVIATRAAHGCCDPAVAHATGLSYSAPLAETGSAPRSISRSTIRGSPPGGVMQDSVPAGRRRRARKQVDPSASTTRSSWPLKAPGMITSWLSASSRSGSGLSGRSPRARAATAAVPAESSVDARARSAATISVRAHAAPHWRTRAVH